MKVIVTGRLPEEVKDILNNEFELTSNPEDKPMDRERLMNLIKDKDGILCMLTDRIDREMLDCAKHLKMIANYAVGYDNIDLEVATEKNILVSNTPGVLTDATADLTMALILAVSRRVVEGDKKLRKSGFDYWAPLHFLGKEVTGKNMGILGLGRIGKAVAKRAKGFDMKIMYYKRRKIGHDEEKRLGVEYYDFEELIKRADFLSVHVPLTEETRHLIGRREFEMMKNTAVLINTSRGPVVDEKALVWALEKGEISGAGLDVYENEPELSAGLKAFKNTVLLPHIGSATVETRTKMAVKAATNLIAGLRGEKPPDCLNWDEVRNSSGDKEGGCRNGFK